MQRRNIIGDQQKLSKVKTTATALVIVQRLHCISNVGPPYGKLSGVQASDPEGVKMVIKNITRALVPELSGFVPANRLFRP